MRHIGQVIVAGTATGNAATHLEQRVWPHGKMRGQCVLLSYATMQTGQSGFGFFGKGSRNSCLV